MVANISEIDRRLIQLTQDACESAKKGRWDEVIAYYAERGQAGLLGQVSPGCAKKLVEWDEWMIGRVKEIHDALQQQILAIQDQRRKLAGVRRQYGHSSSNGYAHHLQTI